MRYSEVCRWISKSQRRAEVVAHLHQPLTATQLAKLRRWDRDACSYLFWELAVYRVVECLNASARRHRVYWLTELGRACQARVRRDSGIPELVHEFPAVPWDLYGAVCYSHRSAILRTLMEALHPPVIKRRARLNDSNLRMTNNNCRDAVKELVRHGVLRQVRLKGERHPRYELTDVGRDCRTLLIGAGMGGSPTV